MRYRSRVVPINFLRPGRAGGGEIEARGEVIKSGRTLAVVDVEVFQDDVAIAKGLFTYLITSR